MNLITNNVDIKSTSGYVLMLDGLLHFMFKKIDHCIEKYS